MAQPNLLEIRDLRVEFETDGLVVPAVRGLELDIRAGESVALIGESGSGKSVTALSIMRLVAGRVRARSLLFQGRELSSLPESEMRAVRGSRIGMIFQEPMTSLNPVFTVGRQIEEVLILHQQLPLQRARAQAIELLRRVGIAAPEERVRQYPHQLSGGMKQRLMIAMAVACRPALLIADEPTTALDVTIQLQIMALLRSLQRELGMAMLLITHDLGVVAHFAERVAVMYAGKIVESGSVGAIFKQPAHPYTRALLGALPDPRTPGRRLEVIPGSLPSPRDWPVGCAFCARCSSAFEPCPREVPALFHVSADREAACFLYAERKAHGSSPRVEQVKSVLASALPPMPAAASAWARSEAEVPLLEVRGLYKDFSLRGGPFARSAPFVRAVEDVSFSMRKGETLSLVGESGSGKTTVGRLVLGLLEPSAGAVSFLGRDLQKLSRADLRQLRRRMQIVFQDPYSSLNPRRTVGSAIAEPLVAHDLARGAEVDRRVLRLLERVGLPGRYSGRFPHELSGGQRQLACIARALSLEPEFVVFDEPVSALDLSIQAQILNLLRDLQAEYRLSYLFISHNLSVVRQVAERVAVMYLGRLVEVADTERLFDSPQHPYTRALLSANPAPDPDAPLAPLPLLGEPPSPLDPPAGCRFHPRCPSAFAPCSELSPAVRLSGPADPSSAHRVWCHLYDHAAQPD